MSKDSSKSNFTNSKYINRKIDGIKESVNGAVKRSNSRIDRLRRRLQRTEEKLVKIEDFLLIGPHANAYKLYLAAENEQNQGER